MSKISPLPGVSRGVLLVLLAWMIWSVDPILIRLIGSVSSLVLAGLALSAGGVTALPRGLKAMREKPPVPWKYWLLFIVYVLLCTGLAEIFYINAVQRLNPGLVSATLRSQLALVVLIGFFAFKERFSWITWLGIAIILVGNLLNGWYRFEHSADQTGKAAWLGWLLAMGAMLCWGFGTVFGKILLRRFAPVTMTALRLTCAGILLITMSLARDGLSVWQNLSLMQILLILCKGCLVSAMGYNLYFHGLKSVKVGIAAAIEQLAPVLTFIYTWLVFRESITPLESSFVAIMLIGTFTTIAGEKKEGVRGA